MKKRINIDSLFKILNIKPKNKKLYIQALTHKTFANENNEFLPYEKLEFIGDSILQMYSSLYIYNHFNNKDEGTMSIIRANNVSQDSLAKIIKENKINEYLICSNNVDELKNNGKICSDIFESLLAAIFLDLGPKEVEIFLERFLFNKIKKTKVSEEKLKDPKTRLQELLQPILKKHIDYDCQLDKDGWYCKAICANNIYGRGRGKTKKEAETVAAVDALTKLKIK